MNMHTYEIINYCTQRTLPILNCHNNFYICTTWYFLGTPRKEPQFFLDFYTDPGISKYSYLSGKMMVTILQECYHLTITMLFF